MSVNTKPFYQEAPQLALFEGVCPNHLEEEVKVTHLGGTAEFLEDHQWLAKDLPEQDLNQWNFLLPGDLTDGNIEFTCPKGCVFTVAHNTFGDWNL